MQIIWHFPYTVNQCFKKQYDRIDYLNDEKDFKNGAMEKRVTLL